MDYLPSQSFSKGEPSVDFNADFSSLAPEQLENIEEIHKNHTNGSKLSQSDKELVALLGYEYVKAKNNFGNALEGYVMGATLLGVGVLSAYALTSFTDNSKD